MKQAVFITHPNYICRRYKNPWDDNGYALGKYNCKELEFEPFDGILTLMRSFDIENGRQVSKVTVKATALGIFDLFFNGKRVGDDEYKPGWTDYRLRAFYYEYDITESVKSKNILTAEVSPGWWSGRISYGFYDFQPCAFAAEIEIAYADGAVVTVRTGEDWQTSICGPVLRADIWDGEYYDARIPHASVLPSAHEWKSAVIFGGFKGKVEKRIGPPVRTKMWLERKPEKATLVCGSKDNGTDFGEIDVVEVKVGSGCERLRLPKGQSVILDMGQNIVGRPILLLKAKRNTRVNVFFGEMLNDTGKLDNGNDGPQGSVYMSNYRSALSRIAYIASGEGEEKYYPTHSFFGFRYIELEADGDVDILSVRGEVIGSDIEENGHFECDNVEINKLYSNVLWGMRGNYFSVPTDCPQRDERFGWSGDTQLFCGAATYIADVKEFLRKWLGDLRDSQHGLNGAYCDVAPRMLGSEQNYGNAAWADAGIVVPYRLWLAYADKQIIEEHYSSMEEYMAYVSGFGLEGAKDFYGDWLSYDKTDNRLIAMAYYAYDAFIMEKLSRVIGRNDRAAYYKELHEKIVTHWRKRYIREGELICRTQTAYAIAISFGLLPNEMKASAAEGLKSSIRKNANKLSTGFVGTALLCRALSLSELNNVCYDLLLGTDDPSWLYSVRQGATTVWERWNSYTTADGFGNVTMNSFNHYAYGAVAEWFYSGICGILPDEKKGGFSNFILRPSPDLRDDKEIPIGQKRILSASASYKTDYGIIKSSWKNTGEIMIYNVSVPLGTTAEIGLISRLDKAVVNGKETAVNRDGKRICMNLGAGEYCIEILN